MPNKRDIVAAETAQREVYEEQILEFAQINNVHYMGECSALADVNIKAVIDQSVEKVYDIKKSKGMLEERKPQLKLTRATVPAGGGCCSNCTPQETR